MECAPCTYSSAPALLKIEAGIMGADVCDFWPLPYANPKPSPCMSILGWVALDLRDGMPTGLGEAL